MTAITGLSEGTKSVLKDYCERQRPRISQIKWVELHLDQDIKNEQGEDLENAKHRKHNDRSSV